MGLRVVFMGTPEFALPSLDALIEYGYDLVAVITQPDRPRGRGQQLQPTPVKSRASALGLRALTPDKLDAAFVAQMSALRPDAIALVAFGRILPVSVLESARLGAFNVHPSLLPRHRGAAPIQRAIMAGDEVTGVSIIRMSERLDAGDILAQQTAPIAPDDDAGALHDRLGALGATLLAETIAAADLGRLHPRRQDEAQATYAAKIERAERAVDWSAAAPALHNRIRGLNPQPCAYTWWRGDRLGLLRTEIAADVAGPPGRIAAIDHGLVVACGEGGLRLLAVKPEGGKAQGALDFVNGRKISPGDAFDPPRAD